MMLKSLLLACALAATQAAGIIAPVGHLGAYGSPYSYGAWNPYSAYPAQPAIATQSSNILRSPFNLGQVSTYTKAIDTPFSSVRKADIRVSNPGVAVAAPYAHYGVAAPVVSHIASPVVSHLGVAPVAKVAAAPGLLGVAYSAAPAVSHMTYSNGLGIAYAW
ncbi:cuticle protein 76-like [Hyposmocoma kahamanoa]|uniref:cuticle protein 76-like n=1 Tax=Hyposmocoma kahamanoa TaxID=1477025 RepID=UPI000E6D8EF5|nr:cuticle protein 76-like [Hyposmocoma kahamanoa]